MRALLTLLMIAGSTLALAQEAAAPISVPLPRQRPEAVTPGGVPLPHERPEGELPAISSAPSSEPSTEPSAEPPPPVDQTPAIPEPVAPPRDYQVACPAVMTGEVTATALPPIVEGRCRLQSPLSLEAVMANGRSIPLNAPAITDCGMVTALPQWVEDVDSYLMAKDNTQIKSLTVGTAYACRNVNNAREGNLSFHAFGDALDVIGFTLEDGRSINVETAWPGTEAQGSKIIRFAHDAACTHFTTVLGPEANALHHDHLHVDLGCHGARCVARLCE